LCFILTMSTQRSITKLDTQWTAGCKQTHTHTLSHTHYCAHIISLRGNHTQSCERVRICSFFRASLSLSLSLSLVCTKSRGNWTVVVRRSDSSRVGLRLPSHASWSPIGCWRARVGSIARSLKRPERRLRLFPLKRPEKTPQPFFIFISASTHFASNECSVRKSWFDRASENA
jgi:hypothetical protein